MKRIFLSVCIALLYTVSTLPIEYSVAIPVTHNPNINQWEVLLGLQNNQWWPFRAPIQKNQSPQNAAQRALHIGVNEQYKVTAQGAPVKKINNLYYYIIPVDYISGQDLYKSARSNQVTDFIWVPISTLSKTAPIQPHPKKATQISNEFLTNFHQVWPKAKAILDQKIPKSSTVASGPWTQYAAQATSWNAIPGALYFYKKSEPYYEFTNFFAPANGILIDNKVWPTTEHYYQAMKYADSATQEYIRTLQTPREAFKYGQKHKVTTPGWIEKNISLEVMRKAVRAKFSYNQNLKKLLLQTGNAILVEDAGKNDAFFGAGADFKGHNWLGRILMEIREELRGKPKAKPQPKKQQNNLVLQLQKLTDALGLLGYELS